MKLYAVLLVVQYLASVAAFAPAATQRSGAVARARPQVVLEATNAAAARCQEKIVEALSPETCEVLSSDDDPNGSHIMITVTAAQFDGISSMKRQQVGGGTTDRRERNL